MSILIKGMKMPENGETITITICDDGIVFEERKEPGSVFKAIPVPPHGRLIDADEIIKDDHQHYEYLSDTFYVTVRDIELAPIIIEAEEASE